MSEIYFLVDLRKLSGFGHFIRTFVIANSLKSKKHQIFYISNNINLEIKNYFKNKKIKTLNYTKFKRLKIKNKLVIVDDYKIKKNFIRLLSKNNFIIMFNDDFKNYSKNVDLLINNNLNFEKKKIKKKNNFLFGKKYLLLRNNISKQKINKNIKNFPVNIYFSLGGFIDKEKLKNFFNNVKEIRYFKENKINFFINISKYYQEIKKIFLKNSNISISFVSLKIDNKFDFNTIDFSINAGGLTSTEMVYLKIPQIIICLSDNQKFNVDFVKKKKIGLEFSKKELIQKVDLNEEFSIFLKKFKNIKLRLLKNNYVDNLGIKRLISRITYL